MVTVVCILGGELVDWYEDASSRGARDVEKEMEIEESGCSPNRMGDSSMFANR